MRLKNNNKAVTHIIGFLLMFVLSTTLLASTVYVTDSYIDSRTRVAARVQAEDIASTVADALLDVASYKNSEPDSSYERIINVPPDLGGRQYYVELTRDKIYVKSVDGQISEEFTTYNIDDYGFEISGKAYGDSGQIRLYCTATQDVANFDFDTDDPPSPTGYGYYHVGLSAYQGNKVFDAEYGKFRKYRIPITIDNTNPPAPIIQSSLYAPEESKDLIGYPVLVRLGPSFLFDLCEENGDDILFRELDEFGNIVGKLPYWIEKWNNDPLVGSASIWVKVTVPKETEKTICMYFGYVDPDNDPDPETYDGSEIFDLFEDFEGAKFNHHRWALIPLDLDPTDYIETDKDEGFKYLHMPYPSYLFAGPKYHYFAAPKDPPDATADKQMQREYKVLFIDAKIRVDTQEAKPGDRPPGQTIIFGQGMDENLVGCGFPAGTQITLDSGEPMPIEQIYDLVEVQDPPQSVTVRSCKFDNSNNVIDYVTAEVEAVFRFPSSLIDGSFGGESMGGYGDTENDRYLTFANSGGTVQCTRSKNLNFHRYYQTPPPFILTGYEWITTEEIKAGYELGTDGRYPVGDYVEHNPLDPIVKGGYYTSYTYELKVSSNGPKEGGCYFADDFLVQSSAKDPSSISTFPHTAYYYINAYDVVDGEASIPESGTLAILVGQQTASGPGGEPGQGFIGGDDGTTFEISSWTHERQMAIAVKESIWMDTFAMDWNYEVIKGIRYSFDSGAEFATADITSEILTGEVFLKGSYGFSYLNPISAGDSLGGGTVNDRYLDIDWIKIQEMIFPEPRIHPGGVEGAFYGWDSKAATIPSAIDRDEPTLLFRDFHINDAGAGIFTIAPLEQWVGADELDKRCTIRITFGDNDHAHDDIRVDIDTTDSEDGSGYVTYFSNIDTKAGEFVTKWAKIEVDTKEKIKIKIIDENWGSNPDVEKGWPLCRLILETGYGGVHLEAD